jgi:hypothetical protein
MGRDTQDDEEDGVYEDVNRSIVKMCFPFLRSTPLEYCDDNGFSLLNLNAQE